ncbi:hypothetical protein PC9H_004236 [Pleurotus ostreatus]|uniref:Uncharacterized protein n=3 Tax=Pleurotus TaxID=5320 RepID=A0A067NT72_PLEO1|nr:uncharacterized protein PC9H_004236 [Pleurotus ostreatus]KAF7437397.1 hypothetical protein PC9H_004236 [Pleurotus ostreatus]KAG9223494.1 hypothetical protein CCMSSC00406_0006986 [Pleurotus cornucopiae]KAJ8703315.1 hypothetical protein PTI98_001949 [Pleurotus ostreatus]KDQ30210.1 hypothetical protein PLEOSDRAFT_1111207 [Pleurotus ostreatus PC15]
MSASRFFSLSPLLVAVSCLLSLSPDAYVGAIKLHPRQDETSSDTLRNITINLNSEMILNASTSVGGLGIEDGDSMGLASLWGYVNFTMSGNWSNNGLGYSGSYWWTRDPNARATLKFRGVAAYYAAPLSFGTTTNQNVSTLIELDTLPSLVNFTSPYELVVGGNTSTVTGLEQNGTVRALWGQTGLADEVHTMVISVGERDQYAILDTLIYTVVINSTSASSAVSASSSKGTTLRIALATCLSVVCAALLVALFLWYRRRSALRRRGSGGVSKWVGTRWVETDATRPEGLDSKAEARALEMDKIERA